MYKARYDCRIDIVLVPAKKYEEWLRATSAGTVHRSLSEGGKTIHSLQSAENCADFSREIWCARTWITCGGTEHIFFFLFFLSASGYGLRETTKHYTPGIQKWISIKILADIHFRNRTYFLCNSFVKIISYFELF